MKKAKELKKLFQKHQSILRASSFTELQAKCPLHRKGEEKETTLPTCRRLSHLHIQKRLLKSCQLTFLAKAPLLTNSSDRAAYSKTQAALIIFRRALPLCAVVVVFLQGWTASSCLLLHILIFHTRISRERSVSGAESSRYC